MLKKDELTDPLSCMNKAEDDEMTFVLLGRDPAAGATIRFWIDHRISLGKDERDSPKIEEAERCAEIMEEQSGQWDSSIRGFLHRKMEETGMGTRILPANQDEFDLTIGKLDRVLSELVNYAKGRKGDLDDENKQTLKHHAEDMVAAAECILNKIGKGVEGTPQP